MKNNYRKLKTSILIQTIFITLLTVCVGALIVEFVIDGFMQGTLADMAVKVIQMFGVEETEAISMYWKYFGHNKQLFIVMGFIFLFFIFFYVAMTKMTKYLNQIEDGVENIITKSDNPILLIEELRPIEDKMNDIKMTLQQQIKTSENSERRKNEMVAFLAHDLKTPLTSIIAYLSALDGESTMSSEDREKYTRIALEKAVRLNDLIQEFFEITRYNLQNIELDADTLDISMMLEQLADELYPVLRECDLSCTVNAEERLMVSGDPDKLARVFDNLLRNAISYSYPHSNIIISAKEVEDMIEISFQNKGNTIPRDKLDTIFEKFYRVDNSRSSKTGGAGLGLAIAKEITEIHQGNIMALSEDNTIQFIVTLPKKNEVDSEEGEA